MIMSAGSNTDSPSFLSPAAALSPNSKTCTKCQLEKPTSDFSRDARKRDGLRPECRACTPRGQRGARSRHDGPSSVQRAERRREQKKAQREAELARDRERNGALNFASILTKQLEEAPDEQSRKELRRTIRGIELRWKEDEYAQRLAVLKALESRTLVTRRDLVELTKLPRNRVQEILDYFTSAKIDLVFITTMGGKRDCGRDGTTLYYGLNR
jgi:hypothetical protein